MKDIAIIGTGFSAASFSHFFKKDLDFSTREQTHLPTTRERAATPTNY